MTDLAPLRHGSLTVAHASESLACGLARPAPLAATWGAWGQPGLDLAFPRAPATATSAARRVECTVTNQCLLLWMKAARNRPEQDVR